MFVRPALLGGPVGARERFGLSNAAERGVDLCKQVCADPVDTESGNYSETISDLVVAGRGFPLAFARTYNSLAAGDDGPLGFGWAHSYGASLAVAPDASTVTVRQENGAEVGFVLSQGANVPAAPGWWPRWCTRATAGGPSPVLRGRC